MLRDFFFKIFCVRQAILIWGIFSITIALNSISNAGQIIAFDAKFLSPTIIHSNEKLASFIHSLITMSAEAAGLTVGEDGSVSNLVFLIRDDAIQDEKINFEVFGELSKNEKSLLENIYFASDECGLEIPHNELAIFVIDPKKIDNPDHIKICIVYGLSLVLEANISRPDVDTSWVNVTTDLLKSLDKRRSIK